MNDLMARYFDDRDSLTTEELRALTEHLEMHPADLVELREHLAMADLLLRRFDERRAVFVARVNQAVAGESGMHSSAGVRGDSTFVATVLRRLGLAEGLRFRLPAPLGYAAVAGVAVLLVIAAQWTMQRHENATGLVELEVLEAADSAAANAPSGFTRGARLAVKELRMPSGFLRFRLDSGAEVAVTGPADLQLLDAMHLLVRHGKVTADVGDRAKGFVVETEQTHVVDLGTKFGVDVVDSGRTDVVVFQGEVELFDHKARRQQDAPMMRLVEGEAVRVNAHRQVSRIANVTSGLRDEEWSTRGGSDASALITSVRDNLRDPAAKFFYRTVAHGLREDAPAFINRRHEWNGLDPAGIPEWLLGADLVQTFVSDRLNASLEITVTVSKPAAVFVFFDDRNERPAWLTERFTDTGTKIGLENAPTLESGKAVAKGPGAGHMAPLSVWKCELPQTGSVTLGPPRRFPDEKPGWNWMYGIAAKAL